MRSWAAPLTTIKQAPAVAIYHLSAQPISRAQGRSATGAAAYRAGVEITDERTGVVHDYTRKGKRGVLHSELILPGGGTADRAEFWNRLEAHHKRGDAVLVREVEISLPTELSAAQRQALAVGYARELADRYGVAADVALHAPRTVTDRDLEKTPNQRWEIDPDTGRRHNGNWHAHIMLSACHVQPDGTLGKKAVELDPIHCQRAKIENMADRERARWGERANAALERHGHEARIDHRSHAERGLDAEPSQHLGTAAAAIERRTGEPSRKRLIFEAEAAERLARAAELGELERQGQALDRAIIDTTGDLQATLRERDQLQAEQAQKLAELGKQQAREAFERQKAAAQARQEAEAEAEEAAWQQELARAQQEEERERQLRRITAEIQLLRPQPVHELVERDPAVIRAEQECDALARRHTEAQARAAQAQEAAAQWRQDHSMRAKLHDSGVIWSTRLDELDKAAAEAQDASRDALNRFEIAGYNGRQARRDAEARIIIEQVQVRSRVAELEQQCLELERAVLEQQRRQAAELDALRQERKRDRDSGPDFDFGL